jgi:hypothetical protein
MRHQCRRLDRLRRHLDAAPAAGGGGAGAPFERCLIANRGEIAIVRASLCRAPLLARSLLRSPLPLDLSLSLSVSRSLALSLSPFSLSLSRALSQTCSPLRARSQRIARAAAGLGIDSVSIYTAPDALSLHCAAATEAIEIGDPGHRPQSH